MDKLTEPIVTTSIPRNIERLIIKSKLMTSFFLQNMPIMIVFMFSLLSLPGEADYLYHICTNTTTFTPNTTFQSNLNHLLATLSMKAATYDTGFYNTTVITPGASQNSTVYGLFLCRGDVSMDVCKDCVANAASEVFQRCPIEKQVVIWYDECMLRYSDINFFGVQATKPEVFMWNAQNTTAGTDHPDVDALAQMYTLITEASKTDLLFKTGGWAANPYTYGLVQCSRDINKESCRSCLALLTDNVKDCCQGKIGWRILAPSCNLRYEVYPFYNGSSVAGPSPLPVPAAPKPMPDDQGKSKTSSLTIVAIVAPIAVVCMLLLATAYCFIASRARKKHIHAKMEASGCVVEDEIITTLESLQFDFGTIEEATNNFAHDNKLGEGGFGKVYKGMLSNGQEIAVKRLSRSSGQGAGEFKNEIVLVARLQHRNLVRLLGFCLEGEEKILVYEYVPNKSLDYFLFDPEKQGQLDWSRRYKIIGGIARGIMYLHEDSRLKIVHRDLKASNILLDGEMNPKISDFGMARLFGADQTQANTNRIVGTYGYMSPEYAMHGQFSVKSDVYSFGVLVLEIISGKKNSYFIQTDAAEDLVNYAWKLWRDGTPLELLDPSRRDSYSETEVIRCTHIGLLCVQEDPADRPTMQSILFLLNSYSITLPLPQQPAFLLRSRTEMNMPMKSVFDETVNNSAPSMCQASISELYPR